MATVRPSPDRRFLQFSLKTLLLLVVAVAVPCGCFKWKLDRKARERAAVAAVEKIGGRVLYGYQLPFAPAGAPPGPEWLRERLGDDFFSDVVEISVASPFTTPDWLVRLEPLTELRAASFDRITDDGVRHLKRFKQLRKLHVGLTVTDTGLAHLAELSTLTRLDLSRCSRVTDAGLIHIARLSNLEDLSLDSSSVTDAGLMHLRGLSKLKTLNLQRTAVSDAGLAHLVALTGLTKLRLGGTRVSDAGLAHLCELSNLTELWLENTEVSGSGLLKLKTLSKLRFLNLSSNADQIGAARAELVRALPGCRIQ